MPGRCGKLPLQSPDHREDTIMALKNPVAITFASLVLTTALPAFAQAAATKPEPCISVVSHATPTARTSTYTNTCATACVEFITTADPEVVPRPHCQGQHLSSFAWSQVRPRRLHGSGDLPTILPRPR
jgi:hypothetical protein